MSIREVLNIVLGALALLGTEPAWAINCHDPAGGFQMDIVCGTPDLHRMADNLDDLAKSRSSVLSSEAARSLFSHEDVWFARLGSLCHLYPRPTDLDFSRRCIRDAYKTRHVFLEAFPGDVAPRAPYLMSGFERSMLVDGIDSDSLGDDLSDRDPMLGRSLRRVIKSIFVPTHVPDAAAWRGRLTYFKKTMTGPSDFYRLVDGRYIFGEACERHLCPDESAILVDTKGGTVTFAMIGPLDTITIVRTNCGDLEEQRHAVEILTNWAESESFPTFESKRADQALPVDVVTSPVCR